MKIIKPRKSGHLTRYPLAPFFMRLSATCILLTAFMVHGFAGNLRAQYVTLHQVNADFETVIEEIRQQTDYDFMIKKEVIRQAKPLTISVRNAPLKTVLKAVIANQNLSFKILDDIQMVVISELPIPTEDEPHFILAIQQVSGRVVDSLNQPLAGASVRVINAEGQRTTLQTTTNRVGEFVLRNVPKDAQLEISYVGYITQTVKAAGNIGVTVLLQLPSALEEVEINAGYYTVKKREQTGNIARVTSEEIELQPIVSPLEALQGRMAGVEVTQGNGMPGGAPTVRIRGQNSLRWDGNYPLYIIDGVPISSSPIDGFGLYSSGGIDPLSTLNLSNIESIEVLKDADATAVYGSRGANGVVLITTKNAKNFNQKTAVVARVYHGVSKVSKRMKLLSTEQYLTLRKAALENDNREPDENSDYDLLLWDQNRYTDWQEELWGGSAPMTDINLAASGGNTTTSFRLSTGYQKTGMVFPGDNSYHKFTTGVNLNHRSENQKFTIGLFANYGLDRSDAFTSVNGYEGNALHLPPNAPALYNDEGGVNWDGWDFRSVGHPIAEAFHTIADDRGQNLITNLVVSYQFYKGLSFKANFGYTDMERTFKSMVSNKRASPENRDGVAHNATERRRGKNSWIVEPQLVYQGKIGKGTIDGLLGATFQQHKSSHLSVLGEGFVSESLMSDLGAAATIRLLNNETVQYRYNALFARLGYNWDTRYFINFTGRRDGSSRFGPGKRFANFIAVGGAWIFSKEAVVKSGLPFLSFGKLRGSYGTTGNDQIGDYGYLDSYEATRGANGLYPTQLFNADYAWEVNKKLEAAIELGFFQDRINLGVSWYRNRSSNQLVGYPLPGITGFSSVQANLPATVQNMGWEVEVTTQNLQSTHFKWSTSLNVSIPKNRLINFPNIDQTSYANIYKVGHPLNIIFLYQYDGIDPETGLYRVVDANEDGRFDSYDQQTVISLGRKYFGGIANNISYKGLELRFLVEFVGQDNLKHSMGAPGAKTQQTVEFYESWQEGANPDVQKVSQDYDASNAYRNYTLSDQFMTDASFLRLKTLSVSYALPVTWLRHVGVEHGKLFFHGQNLFTITQLNRLNVESPSSNRIPTARTLTGGIQLNF